MAKKKRTRSQAAANAKHTGAELGKSAVVGQQVMRPLKEVAPNEWNPNRMTPQLRASLKHGLKTDGWLASQALLIWATNENGEAQDVIIDGEHRWTVAMELGFDAGPMVMLHNLTEAQAKALTVKMNQKRGEFQQDLLTDLMREIQFEVGADDMALEMGFEAEDMMKMLSPPDIEEMTGVAPPKNPTTSADRSIQRQPVQGDASQLSNIKLVQLFFDDEKHEKFRGAMKRLGEEFGTANVSDTVYEAVIRADSTSE